MQPITKQAPRAAASGLDAHELAAARLVSIDIETRNPAPKLLEELVASKMADWSPPANYKDQEKIAKLRQEAEAKARERGALHDFAPVACVAVRTDKVGVVFNGIDEKPYQVNHSTVVSCGDESRMLVALRDWLDRSTNAETLIIGHNLFAFDLPKLRGAYARARLRLPAILQPRILDDEKQPAVDVMRLFCKQYTVERVEMCSLDMVSERLGLPKYKDQVDGSQIPGLIDEGRIAEVLEYCAVDTMTPMAAYLVMTSQSSEMK